MVGNGSVTGPFFCYVVPVLTEYGKKQNEHCRYYGCEMQEKQEKRKRKKKENRVRALALGYLVMLCFCGCGKADEAPPYDIGGEDMVFTEQLGPGWNLGNSLEAVCADGRYSGNALELYWQNPATTKEMIDEVCRAGFTLLRLPVTWEGHMDEQGKIDEQWLGRVKEIVDYGIDNGMYVIINAHHDTWFEPLPENEEYARNKMRDVWQQVGGYFAEYDNHLLFEGMNEPRWIGSAEEWTGGSSETAAIVNGLNQVFVDTVRGLGGRNEERYLLVATYGNSVEECALEAFTMPEGEHLIVTVHAYIPYGFAMDVQGKNVWESRDAKEIGAVMKRLGERFVSKGIPVLIGEFGAVDKGNSEERLKWLKDYMEAAKEYRIGCIWWDEGGWPGETYGRFRIYDRDRQEWLFPEIQEVLVGK